MKTATLTKPAHSQKQLIENTKAHEMGTYIKAIFITSLKEFEKQVWPAWFAARPQLGDYVKSEAGKELIIQRITHCHDFKTDKADKYYLEIELGKA